MLCLLDSSATMCKVQHSSVLDHKYFWCYCRKKFLIEFKVAFAENDSLNPLANPDSTAPKVIIVDLVQSVQHSLRNGLFLALIKFTSGYATVNLSICHVQVKKHALQSFGGEIRQINFSQLRNVSEAKIFAQNTSLSFLQCRCSVRLIINRVLKIKLYNTLH